MRTFPLTKLMRRTSSSRLPTIWFGGLPQKDGWQDPREDKADFSLSTSMQRRPCHHELENENRKMPNVHSNHMRKMSKSCKTDVKNSLVMKHGNLSLFLEITD